MRPLVLIVSICVPFGSGMSTAFAEGHTKVQNESSAELMNHGREVDTEMQLLDLLAKLLKAEREK